MDKAAKKEARKAEREAAKAKRKEETKDLKIGWQYTIGVIVVFGGFVAGTGIGWSSPAAKLLKDEGLTDDEFPWVASIFALGAAIAQFLVVVMVKLIGAKYTIVILHIVVIISWVPLSITNNFYGLLAGRFICGFSGGFCSVCPMMLGEIAHKCHRGTLSVFFQLFITGGILYTYCVGVSKDLVVINIACGAWSVAGIILTVLFVPESPYGLLKKGKTEKADKVMKRIRGPDYDRSKEMAEMQAEIDVKESAIQGMKQTVNLKAFGTVLAVHIFQQLTGINAILYHAHDIFEEAGTNISEDLSVIIIGIAQVLICLLAAVVVDRSGRILLFLVSLFAMGVCLVLVGVYFTVYSINTETAKAIAFIPTAALVIYICGFSLGMGPLPWALIGEYFPRSCKTIFGVIISACNWLLAFLVSWLMPVLMKSVPVAYIFYAFAIVCALGIVFVLLFVIETNQKSFDEIQADLRDHKIGFNKSKRT